MNERSQDGRRPPVAFISHATADKERFVLGFATRLRSAGVEAWVDRWELRPGDSLVRRIFEGIADADAFVVVVSANSINSRWVQEELDAGFMKKLEGSCRVIPVVLDGVTPPAPLQTTLWERVANVDSYDTEFDRIVRAIYGADLEKPPLGPSPSYASQAGEVGLAATDAVVLQAIGDTVLNREEIPTNPVVGWDALEQTCAKQGLDEHGLEESVEALKLSGLAKPDHVFNRRAPVTVMLTRTGLRSYLILAGFDLAAIERELASRLVNDGLSDGSDIRDALGAPWPVVELLLDELARRSLVRISKPLGRPAVVFEVSPVLRRRLAL